MNKVFFDELGIPEPDYNLEVGSASHGWQAGEMIKRTEKINFAWFKRPSAFIILVRESAAGIYQINN